jgi:hypothetical protein
MIASPYALISIQLKGYFPLSNLSGWSCMLVEAGSFESQGTLTKKENTLECELGQTWCCGRKSLVISIFEQIENIGDIFVFPQPFFRSAVPRVVVAPGTFVTVSGQRLDSIQAASFGPRSTIEVSLLTIESSMIIIKLGNILRNGNFSLQYSLDGQLFSTSNL